VPAADVINPKRTIPRATILGTLISSALYILGTIAVMGVVPMHQLAQSSAPFSDAAQLMFGKVGAVIVTCAALISTLGAINGWILLQGQVPFAAAKDKLFHRAFAKESSNGTPYFSLIISSVLITILLFFSSGSLVSIFTFMILLATMATLFVYLFSCIAEIKLMIKKPKSFSGGVLTRDIVICFLAVAYIIWTIIGSGWQMILYGLLLFITGIPFYIWMYFHHRLPKEPEEAV
jgi:APA family basic amino acid/polyamine antiporter